MPLVAERAEVVLHSLSQGDLLDWSEADGAPALVQGAESRARPHERQRVKRADGQLHLLAARLQGLLGRVLSGRWPRRLSESWIPMMYLKN